MNSRYNDLSLCASGIGCRVVRGPDWKWGNQDGGNGHVGSLRRFEARGEAVVLWDSGIVANYRCGALGFDLRVLDSSPTGRRHLDTICEGCNESPIYGIRWKCMLCLNVDLCSSCYHGDKHCLSHPFLRIATPHGVRVAVGRRSKAQKTDAVGLFPRARVVRGFDWRWGTQDCATVIPASVSTAGNVGTALTNALAPQTSPGASAVSSLATCESATPCQGRIIDRRDWFQWAPKSAVSVAWDSGAYNVYRVGYMGMVDLKAVRPAKGGSYYAEHLPLLGDLRDLPSQSEADSSASVIAIPSQLQPPLPHPIENIVWMAAPCTRGQIATPSSTGAAEVYEESAIIDPGDRIPLTDAESGPRPSSVPTQRPRGGGGGGTGSSRTLLADLFCAGGGGGSAPSEDGSATTLGSSPPPAVSSRPSPASRSRQVVLPGSYRSSTLRLRPGAVIQLRLRSMVNENAVAAANSPGSEYLSLPSVVERVDDTTGSVVLLIPQTGQRFTLTSSASSTCQQQWQGRSEERLLSRHASANSNLLTRMRRRDSYARAAAAAAASTSASTSAVTVGETGLVENQQPPETSQPTTSQSQSQETHESVPRSLLKQSSKQVTEELMFAAAEGNVKKITWLIKHRDINVNTHYAGATALHVACQSGHLNCVDVLLQNGADCRERDADGNQALHAAAQGGALPVLRRIAATLSLMEREPHPSTSAAEVSLPPDVNARNALRQTPLHLATVGRHLECARSLLEEFNAIPSLQDCDGDTPLHDAVSGENLAMVELLLANRADLAITNSLGHNCLHHAAMLGNPSVFCALMSYCDQMPWLLDEARPDGFTPLHIGVLYGHTAIVDCLLLLPPATTGPTATGTSGGSAVNVNAESALMLAGSSGTTLGNRLTPLHLAVQKGNAPVVCLLLARGALPCARDAAGKSPLDLSLALLRRSTTTAVSVSAAAADPPSSDVNLSEASQSESPRRTTVVEGNRIELSMVPFLASVARYLVVSANCEEQSLQSLPSALRGRIESVVQTALNSGISAPLLIAACLVAAVGLQLRDVEPTNLVAPPACLSTLEDSVLELALQQCFLEACLASAANTEVPNATNDDGNSGGDNDRSGGLTHQQHCLLDNSETSTLNDFFATDNRSETRVLQSGTVSPTGSSMSIANFLVPSEWSAGAAIPAELSHQQQKQADFPLSLLELSEELRECMVCSSRDRGALLTPCGHIVACQQCTQLLKKCIICRQQVEAYREIPACRECTFRPAVTLTRSCNHFLVCRECLVPRVARLNRALEVAGDDDDEQAKPEWLLDEGVGEQRRHQLLLSLFNAGELCPDGVCPECGQIVTAVWSLEVAVGGVGSVMERFPALPSSVADVGMARRTALISTNTQDLLVPIAVSQTSTVWVASENNQVVAASAVTPRCLVPKDIFTSTGRETLPRYTQAGGTNARPNNMRPSGSVISSGQSSSRELKRLQHELQAMREQTRCPICLDRSRNLVFMCGHATCQWCGDQVAVCPICRRTVTGRIVLY
ncbi:E3 ubiquitin-protein ligase mind-bomb [Taenia crassiceps]|uniref:E3 ubiquitin-protein ligase mind-bomb n=1 Tax=Taenia crassiceps TaxID=6207 RepID=A0ABR4QDK9_9CEST